MAILHSQRQREAFTDTRRYINRVLLINFTDTVLSRDSKRSAQGCRYAELAFPERSFSSFLPWGCRLVVGWRGSEREKSHSQDTEMQKIRSHQARYPSTEVFKTAKIAFSDCQNSRIAWNLGFTSWQKLHFQATIM